MTNFMTKIAAQTCYHSDSGRISATWTVMVSQLTKDNVLESWMKEKWKIAVNQNDVSHAAALVMQRLEMTQCYFYCKFYQGGNKSTEKTVFPVQQNINAGQDILEICTSFSNVIIIIFARGWPDAHK